MSKKIIIGLVFFFCIVATAIAVYESPLQIIGKHKNGGDDEHNNDTNGPSADMNSTYGELAETLMVPAYAAMMKDMGVLTNTTLPSNPAVKRFRNEILAVRNILDVFVFAYPTPHPDVWEHAREDMNVGYTIIGDFKDLVDSHVNYTEKQLEKLRKECLNWQSDYNKHSIKYNYSYYLQNPSPSELFTRPENDYSQFFWGADTDIQPTLNRTGYQNIAYLMKALTTSSIDNYDMFGNLTEIYRNDTQLVFHGYRKAIRGIDSVSNFAMEIYRPNTPCVSGAIAQCAQFFSLIGKIEDQITAYDYYVQHNEIDEIQQEITAIDKMWASLHTWMATNKPIDSLICLLNSLIEC